MQSFLERLQFPFLTYTDPPASIFPGKIRTGFIFILGADKNMAEERGFDARIAMHEFILKMIFGNSESLSCYDTHQFNDYSKVFALRWDPEKKAKRRAEVFRAIAGAPLKWAKGSPLKTDCRNTLREDRREQGLTNYSACSGGIVAHL